MTNLTGEIKMVSRKELVAELKQLREEGYVTEGFSLTASLWDLDIEAIEARNRKAAHKV